MNYNKLPSYSTSTMITPPFASSPQALYQTAEIPYTGAPGRQNTSPFDIDWSDEDDEELKPGIGNDDLHIGEATPVGDACWPLLLCLSAYILIRKIRTHIRLTQKQ